MLKSTLTAAAAIVIAALHAPAHAAGVAEQAQAFVRQHLSGVITSPQVIDAVKAQNAKNGGLSQSEIDALDALWRAGDANLIGPVLENDLSRMLADLVRGSGGAFSEIFVMDAVGLNVGQSDRTSDFWQGDEAKWQETFLRGAEAVHVSDVEEDESTQTFQVQVSMTVSDAGAPVGAITVGVDVEHLE